MGVALAILMVVPEVATYLPDKMDALKTASLAGN